jgi:hypothetical protein
LVYFSHQGFSDHYYGTQKDLWASKGISICPRRLGLAELYQKDVRTTNEHLKDIYSDRELTPEATIREFRIVRRELWKTRPGIYPPRAGTTTRGVEDAQVGE